MFTGLIKYKIKILAKEKASGGYQLIMARPSELKELEVGESISLDGICLTLEKYDDSTMTFFVGMETLSVTSFLSWKPGDIINVEQSLRAGDRMGGHIVSGHIDGTAVVASVNPAGSCLELTVKLSDQLRDWVIPKGSIAINGVSLTINKWDLEEALVELFLIPETLRSTNLANLEPGEFVNIECDPFVKVLAAKFKEYKGAQIESNL